ncbi:MAG: hypothetical protein WCG75_08495 [Armatimonadota bacterium]
MSRFLILTAVVFFTIGCGNNEAQNQATAANNTSVTMVRPVEKELGPTTMKDFAAASGLKAYPGTESAEGKMYDHGDQVTKYVFNILTGDTTEKIAAFYKAEGMDVKNPTMPMGMTKSGAQVIINVAKQTDGKNLITIKGLVAAKK